MKKIISALVVVTILFAAILTFTAFAASADASLTGPGTVRAGDTITLNFNLNGSNLYGTSGSISYDSSQVTLVETSQKIESPWAVEFSGSNFVAYDNNLTNPINENKAIFTATFTVNNISAGTDIVISCDNIKVSDGNADADVGTVKYSATVAQPLSTDNNLASLNVSNATISPSFSADTTKYTASVPFEVSKLDVSASAADSKASVSVSSTNLIPEATTNVTVTVTAENGAKKTYTIAVTRAADPNYVASSNNMLSDIKIDGFLLSPVFNENTTSYLVWLPYETDKITVTGTASDSKASVEVVGGENLAAGQDNTVKIICTAENGDKKEYTVIAKRAAAHDGSVDEKPSDPVIDSVTNEDTDSEPLNTNTQSGIKWYWLLVVGIAALAVGIAAGFFGKDLIFKK